MGIITPTSEAVRELRGLHLYHSAISNCSMRVRMALDEKQLAWESHHLDLTKGETHTAEYFGINPDGVVPTLVDNGVVIVESDDIIEYIDEHYPAPPLRPQDPQLRAQVHEWLKLATGIHVRAVKTWIYQNKMRGKLAMSDADWDAYCKRQSNPELLAFHAKSRSEQGFSAAEVAAAKQLLDEGWRRVEQALGKSDWLAGDQFSLADIAWVPLHFTLIGANFDFAPYPSVQRWEARLRERHSFQEGVLRWCPKF
jgi:GST-like protein